MFKEAICFPATLLSTNKARLESLVSERYLSEAGLMAYDTTSAGIALSCQLAQVSLLSIKAVCWRIGKEDERLSRVRKGLEASPQ
jgi:hypothetical protein